MSNTSAQMMADRAAGAAAMERLADRLTAMAPAPLDLSANHIVRQSPAVAAGLSASPAPRDPAVGALIPR